MLFRKVTTQDIVDFKKNYEVSMEEWEDLKTAYVEFKGDMDEILSNVLCSTLEDEDRFAGIIMDWIKTEEVPDFKKFSKETQKSKENRKRKFAQEAAEAEEMKAELGLGADGTDKSLHALIQSRQQSRQQHMENFFDDLEAKYSKPKNTKTAETKGKKKGKK